jgi:tol-pal system protein YbgF
MHKLKHFVTLAGFAALMSAASPILAESAPVFDADAFEAGTDQQAQDLPMPPPPGDEAQAAQTFVPANGSGAVTSGVSANPAPVPTNSLPPAADPSAPASGVSVSTANMSPEQRVRRLEQQLSNLQNSQSAKQVEALQAEVQNLRGQVEVLNHQLTKVQTQQKSLTSEAGAKAEPAPSVLDNSDTPTPVAKKVAAKKAAVSGEPVVAKSAEAAIADQPNVAEEQKIYQTAYDLIKAKKYNEAVTALQDMLKKYPTGQFASNAHYWLGELYGLMGKNDNALSEFTTVIAKFPGSPRVSDAELKVGLILAAQSKWADAKKAFKKVINTYPGTASSRLASEQLKMIKQAGN